MQLILFKTEVVCQWDLLNIFKQNKLSRPRNKKICIIAIGNKLVAAVSLIPVTNYSPGSLKELMLSNNVL
jgi:hypothetical protein